MRVVDEEAIAQHASIRFRSEYHYALFEYWRSAKLLRYLERADITNLGQVLDDGCGGGGMCVSVAEETDYVVGIDLSDRFTNAGTRLAAELNTPNITFAQANGTHLPLPDRTYETVLYHAVLDHVTD